MRGDTLIHHFKMEGSSEADSNCSVFRLYEASKYFRIELRKYNVQFAGMGKEPIVLIQIYISGSLRIRSALER